MTESKEPNSLTDEENEKLNSQADILLGFLMANWISDKGKQAIVMACILLAYSTEEEWRCADTGADWLLAENLQASIKDAIDKFMPMRG